MQPKRSRNLESSPSICLHQYNRICSRGLCRGISQICAELILNVNKVDTCEEDIAEEDIWVVASN